MMEVELKRYNLFIHMYHMYTVSCSEYEAPYSTGLYDIETIC